MKLVSNQTKPICKWRSIECRTEVVHEMRSRPCDECIRNRFECVFAPPSNQQSSRRHLFVVVVVVVGFHEIPFALTHIPANSSWCELWTMNCLVSDGSVNAPTELSSFVFSMRTNNDFVFCRFVCFFHFSLFRRCDDYHRWRLRRWENDL